MLQPFLKHALEEDILVFIELALAPKAVVLPLANVLVNLIEPIAAGTASLALHELSFVGVTVVIDGLAEPVGLGVRPRPAVLLDVVVFDWLVLVGALTVGLPLRELPLVH